MKRANPLAFAMTPASTDEPGSPRSTNRQLPPVAGDIARWLQGHCSQTETSAARAG